MESPSAWHVVHDSEAIGRAKLVEANAWALAKKEDHHPSFGPVTPELFTDWVLGRLVELDQMRD